MVHRQRRAEHLQLSDQHRPARRDVGRRVLRLHGLASRFGSTCSPQREGQGGTARTRTIYADRLRRMSPSVVDNGRRLHTRPEQVLHPQQRYAALSIPDHLALHRLCTAQTLYGERYPYRLVPHHSTMGPRFAPENHRRCVRSTYARYTCPQRGRGHYVARLQRGERCIGVGKGIL